MHTLAKALITQVLLLLILQTAKSQTSVTSPGFLSITNNVFWDTKDGLPLYSQGGRYIQV